MKKFCELLAEARIKKGLTKARTAEHFNWTHMYYGRYESGDILPGKKNVAKFAAFIGMPSEKLQKIVDEERKQATSIIEDV